jgi:hypothetical protein
VDARWKVARRDPPNLPNPFPTFSQLNLTS